MRKVFCLGAVFALLLVANVHADEPKTASTSPQNKPFTDWQKLETLLQERYFDKAAVTKERLDEAVVKGILDSLGSCARILYKTTGANESAKAASAIARSEIINDSIGYLQFENINDMAPSVLDRTLEKLGGNKLSGLILDLRFAGGFNFGNAVAVASRFLPKGSIVLSVKNTGEDKTQEFVNADIQGLTIPIVVLVNGQTHGAAEAVAASLSAQKRAIVIGNRSAGTAAVQTDIPLDDVHVLQLTTGRIIFPNGLEVFPKGLVPDVIVPINEATEKDVLIDNPSPKTLTELLTSKVVKGRLNEAELVKTSKGEVTTLMQPTKNRVQKTEEIKDVVIERAVDLLRSIAVLSNRQS